MRIKIEVTHADIQNGKPQNCYDCPIALAVKRALPGREIEVHTAHISIDDGHASLPKEAMDWIENYDKPDGSVMPFSFEIGGDE